MWGTPSPAIGDPILIYRQLEDILKTIKTISAPKLDSKIEKALQDILQSVQFQTSSLNLHKDFQRLGQKLDDIQESIKTAPPPPSPPDIEAKIEKIFQEVLESTKKPPSPDNYLLSIDLQRIRLDIALVNKHLVERVKHLESNLWPIFWRSCWSWLKETIWHK